MKQISIIVMLACASLITTINTQARLPGELPPSESAVAFHQAQAQMNGGGGEGMSPDHPSLRNYPHFAPDFTGEVKGGRKITDWSPVSYNPDDHFRFKLDWRYIRIMSYEVFLAKAKHGEAEDDEYDDDFKDRVLGATLNPHQLVGVDIRTWTIVCDMHCRNRLLRRQVKVERIQTHHCQTCPQRRPQVQICQICHEPLNPRQPHRCGGGHRDPRFGGGYQYQSGGYGYGQGPGYNRGLDPRQVMGQAIQVAARVVANQGGHQNQRPPPRHGPVRRHR